jgi:hypothetical protein
VDFISRSLNDIMGLHLQLWRIIMCKWCKENKECWVACLDLRKKEKSGDTLTKTEKQRLENNLWGNTMQTLDTL